MLEKLERRTLKIELRQATDDGGKPLMRGYAAVFNSLSEDLGGFREQIMPGAFKDALGNSDARALWNHNPDYPLGRQSAGTLRMSEDKTGLAIEIDPPDTQYARDLAVCMERGDIKEMSFAFTVPAGGAVWDEQNGEYVRSILRFEKIYDVSPVTYPAYPDTEIGFRSAQDILLDYKPVPPAGEKRSDVEILRLHLELKNKEVI